MGLSLEGVSKVYPGGAIALADIDLDIPSGSSLALVGGSGSGKTTLLKLLNRIHEPTTGLVRMQGQPAAEVDIFEYRRRFGYVVQRGGLFPHMTVRQNVCLPGKLQGWSQQRLAQRTRELLELVELPEPTYGPRLPHQLSGGQQQRVGIARALFLDPGYLLLDEPLGALDPVTRKQLQGQIGRLAAEKTLVVVTHDMAEARVLCRRIAVMHQGRLLQLGTAEELRSNPASDFVRLLFEDQVGGT